MTFYCDSQRLSATTAATPASSTTAAAASATTATAASATTATIHPAAPRSHAGGATIAVPACIGSIESPGTTAEGTPVPCTTARKITIAYAIGSAHAASSAGSAIRATDTWRSVAGACIPAKAA